MNGDPLSQLKSAALTDMDFRRQVIANPSEALQSVGIEPTQDLLNAIQKLIQDLEALGAILGLEDIEAFS